MSDLNLQRPNDDFPTKMIELWRGNCCSHNSCRKRQFICPVTDIELALEREKNKKLVAKIQIIEANAGRLGIDPEELHKAIPKPIRTVSRAGSSHKRWFGNR